MRIQGTQGPVCLTIWRSVCTPYSSPLRAPPVMPMPSAPTSSRYSSSPRPGSTDSTTAAFPEAPLVTAGPYPIHPASSSCSSPAYSYASAGQDTSSTIFWSNRIVYSPFVSCIFCGSGIIYIRCSLLSAGRPAYRPYSISYYTEPSAGNPYPE